MLTKFLYAKHAFCNIDKPLMMCNVKNNMKTEKKMKKFFSTLAIIAITMFSLAGCSDKSAGTDSAGTAESTDYSHKDS